MKAILDETAKKPLVYAVETRWHSISPVGINGFPIPKLLLELIDSGHWTNRRFARFPHELFAGETELETYSLYQMACENLYWPLDAGKDFIGSLTSHSRPGTIDPSQSILIADFGLGSDQPIAIDYRNSVENPSVIAMRWQQPFAANCWIELAGTFDEFALLIGVK